MKLLNKYAQQKDLELNIVKIWRDYYSNLIVILELNNKKYSVIGKEQSNSWNHFHGIGSSKVTTSMPAGRGDYLIGDPVVPEISKKITEALISQRLQPELIDNKNGISWAPTDETQKNNLAKLIEKSSEINSYLSQIGMIYSGGDKLIFGEDITKDNILVWNIPQQKNINEPTLNKSSPAKPQQKKEISSRVNNSGLLGGATPEWVGKNGYTLGPKYHAERPMGNWQSDNAWDVGSPPGTQIYSITKGRVAKIKESSTNNPKVYGTQITISGEDGYPDIFYTHTIGVNLSQGDQVSIGTPIAQIAQPTSKGMTPHVHVGLANGAVISTFINEDGSFK